MNRKRAIASIIIIFLTVILTVRCRPSPSSTSLLIAAAASLQPALAEIDPQFKAVNPNITVNYTFAASGALQQQIQQGALIDLFISAATQPIDALQNANLLLPNSCRNLLTNQLVIVVPRQSQRNLTDLKQLSDPTIQKISLGEPKTVPAGQYAAEALNKLGLWQPLQSKLVYGNSVRNVLGTVESGNADAGIVYSTDANHSNQVKSVITIPSHLHAPIVYAIATIRHSKHPQATQIYSQFLSSQPAQVTFKKYGFGIA
jgi:molybdate transport system substrate-binding protein